MEWYWIVSTTCLVVYLVVMPYLACYSEGRHILKYGLGEVLFLSWFFPAFAVYLSPVWLPLVLLARIFHYPAKYYRASLEYVAKKGEK